MIKIKKVDDVTLDCYGCGKCNIEYKIDMNTSIIYLCVDCKIGLTNELLISSDNMENKSNKSVVEIVKENSNADCDGCGKRDGEYTFLFCEDGFDLCEICKIELTNKLIASVLGLPNVRQNFYFRNDAGKIELIKVDTK